MAPDPRVCEQCKESYVPKYRPRRDRPPQRFCSKRCATKWRNLAGLSGGVRRPPDWARTRQLAKSRARRLRHAETWDGITDEEILERDGWRCQIPGCKRRPIRKDLKSPHPRSKSIDHIIPESLGGDDIAENKRAAHLGCNIARSNRIGYEQVALFGSIREAPLATMTVGERLVKLQRKPRACPCGGKPVRYRKFCQPCGEQYWAEVEARRRSSTPVYYYTCRYCGELGVGNANRRVHREVCPDRPCQLARRQANNLRLRNGWTREEADAFMAELVRHGKTA